MKQEKKRTEMKAATTFIDPIWVAEMQARFKPRTCDDEATHWDSPEEQRRSMDYARRAGYDALVRDNIVKVARMGSYVTKAPKGKRGLYLYGNVGVGKTFAAEIIAGYLNPERFESVRPGSVIIDADWFALAWKGYAKDRQQMQDIANSSKHLIIDDLGIEPRVPVNGKDGEMEVMEWVIHKRHRAWEKKGALTIFTSNLTMDELGAKYEGGQLKGGRYDSRAMSRLRAMVRAAKITGPDRRDGESVKRWRDRHAR